MRYLNKKYHKFILFRSKSGENSKKIQQEIIKTFGLKYRFEIPSYKVKLTYKLNYIYVF